MMSEVFEGYERQYCELSASLSKKISSASLLDGEQKKQKISDVKTGLDEADALIRKMDLEARGLQPNVKAVLLAKLREYKSDMNNLKNEVKRIASTNLNQAARDELLEAGLADTLTVSANQRDRLFMSTERLNTSSNRIRESRKVMLETEDLGVSLLQDLHQQRQSLLQANNALHGVDDNISRSRKIITSISRRMNRNKWTIAAVITVLVIAILVILYFKLSKNLYKNITSSGFHMRWPTNCATPSSLARHCRALVRSCARHSLLDAGQKLHAATVTTGLVTLPKTFLRNVILHMYAACGDVLSARKVFDEIPNTDKDTVDWTTLMDCYSCCGAPLDALSLFATMRREGVSIDEITMVSVFSTCAKVGNHVFGIQGHVCMIKMGFDFCVKAQNAATDMYVKCGLMSDAKMLFDEMSGRNVVSWTVLLWGVMKWEGLERGKDLFDEMPERNEIAWTIMIARHVENGFITEAFGLLTEMLCGFGFRLNSASLCSLLSACTQSGDVVLGKWVHSCALKGTVDASTDVKLSTALLDMYAKCGRIKSAILVFKSMPTRNVVTWNAMLGGLAMHGKGAMVLDMFNQMLEEVNPNDVTFTAVLSACSHSGLVDQGRQIFYSLESVYGIRPSMENYACMVDLLGRAGLLEEAETVLRGMPMRPNEVVLGSLLGACRVHRREELGERLVRELVQMYPHNTDHHVLLSNMYVLSGKSDKADSLRRDLRDRGIRKFPGISTMYINGQVHQFSAGEKSHPQIKEIYLMLDEMIRKLRLAGYVPDMASQIISDGGSGDSNVEEEKERALLCHSEKLAVCFGLISTKAGTPLYIFKNLRICQDCHSAMKIVSRIYDREIVIRDRNRFHSFKFGLCSCSDYW
ncbi:hypothetical protein BUALT_Bualt04G0142200 [Buddleja alternifolia]|uniref:Pentatricopeptide repeat-containing protein n=1 Tax=Buddleja alternifolia TaxID=168488 RepID=A0AAV6XNU0_9LAMI|nr:hypothetical protein BUALT_Bualt04G0142200 [Buddleja alternifolia]